MNKTEGVTKIPYGYCDAVRRLSFTGLELRITFLIMRYSYGCNVPFAKLSYGDLSKLTGNSLRGVKKAIKSLRKQNAIIVQSEGAGTANYYCLNERFEEWGAECE